MGDSAAHLPREHERHSATRHGVASCFDDFPVRQPAHGGLRIDTSPPRDFAQLLCAGLRGFASLRRTEQFPDRLAALDVQRSEAQPPADSLGPVVRREQPYRRACVLQGGSGQRVRGVHVHDVRVFQDGAQAVQVVDGVREGVPGSLAELVRMHLLVVAAQRAALLGAFVRPGRVHALQPGIDAVEVPEHLGGRWPATAGRWCGPIRRTHRRRSWGGPPRLLSDTTTDWSLRSLAHPLERPRTWSPRSCMWSRLSSAILRWCCSPHR